VPLREYRSVSFLSRDRMGPKRSRLWRLRVVPELQVCRCLQRDDPSVVAPRLSLRARNDCLGLASCDDAPSSHLCLLRTSSTAQSLMFPARGPASLRRGSAGCIIPTHDAQPEPKPRSHTTSGVSMTCAYCTGLWRMPQSDYRGQHLATDNVLRNDKIILMVFI
jgi:hypothetical protein